MILVEGLRGLERLEGEEVFMIALPLPIQGSDGSPCPVVALDGDTHVLAAVFSAISSAELSCQ